jgi:hypothetical protein
MVNQAIPPKKTILNLDKVVVSTSSTDWLVGIDTGELVL